MSTRAGFACVAAALLWGAAASAYAQAPGDTTNVVGSLTITNVANSTYEIVNGALLTPGSNHAGVVITEKFPAALSLITPTRVVMKPGSRYVFAHSVTNTGAAGDRVQLVMSPPAGWVVSLYRDINGDGKLDAGDTPVGASLGLARGQTIRLLVVVDVPITAPDDSLGKLVSIRGVSTLDSTVATQLSDTVAVEWPSPAVAMTKIVDRFLAAQGDTLTYRIAIANSGSGAALRPVLTDVLPVELLYAPGSAMISRSGVSSALTDTASDGDGFSVSHFSLRPNVSFSTITPGSAKRDSIAFAMDSISPGAADTLVFKAIVRSTQLRVIDSLAPKVVNVATLSFHRGSRVDSVTSMTASAHSVRIVWAGLIVKKVLVGSGTASVGESIQYQMNYRNSSDSVVAHGTVLTDSLPPSLAYSSSSGGPAGLVPIVVHSTDPTALGGQVVSWLTGQLAPGESGVIMLTTRVVSRGTGPAGSGILNQVSFAGANMLTRSAAATALTVPVASKPVSELKITKTSGVLEAGLGDVVPYAIALSNTGLGSIGNIVVHDILPVGLKVIPGRHAGVDSVVVGAPDGRSLSFYVTGSLSAGQTRGIVYSTILESPPNRVGSILANKAWAVGANGLVHTDTVVAPVRLRAGFAMASRIIIGKVWLDKSGQGKQGANDPGVAGARLWSSDGEEVTTDSLGRFSFPNVPVGTVAIRLDTVGLPRSVMLPKHADGMVIVQTDGWTTPRVSIRVIPRLVTATNPSTIAVDANAAHDTSVASRGVGGLLLRDDGPIAFESPSADERFPVRTIFVRLKGTPNMPVKLYDGNSLLRSATLRIDGTQDFIGVPLTAGPHELRAEITVAGGVASWDSVHVHVSGAVGSIQLESASPVSLRANGMAGSVVRARVLDTWGVPSSDRPMITVSVSDPDRVVILGKDADQSDVGEQRQTDVDGWVSVEIRGRDNVGQTRLLLAATTASAKTVTATAIVRVTPELRPFMLTGVGQIVVGSGAPSPFAAMTGTGSIGHDATLDLRIDTRRAGLASSEGFFANGYDPLDEGRYPTLGDGSQHRVVGGATGVVSAKISRGLDWVNLGDINTGDLTGTGLGGYQRSVAGLGAQLTTHGLAPVLWHGFASMTSQAVEQTQVQGDGSTGPFYLGSNIRAGTDRLWIEVRSSLNAMRVIDRRPLTAFTDYRLDPITGIVLLSNPLPSTDAYQNPLFLVATFERTAAGPKHFVGGIRGDINASRLLGFKRITSETAKPGAKVPKTDSLGVGVVIVTDQSATPGVSTGVATSPMRNLLGIDGRLRLSNASHGLLSGVEVGGALLEVSATDTSAAAAKGDFGWTSKSDKAHLTASWSRTGFGFAALQGIDQRLTSGAIETRMGGDIQVADSLRLAFTRESQKFVQFGASRTTTGISADGHMFGRHIVQNLGIEQDKQGTPINPTVLSVDTTTSVGKSEAQNLAQSLSPGATTALTAKTTIGLTARTDAWLQASHFLSSHGSSTIARPDQAGVGVTTHIFSRTSIDASERWTSSVIANGIRSPGYTISSVQLRTGVTAGGEVWGGLERAAVTNTFSDSAQNPARASNTVVLGWQDRISLGAGWGISGGMERHLGLGRVPLVDPVRTLPFPLVDPNRSSNSLGLDWLPSGKRGRFALKFENHHSSLGDGQRVSGSGDYPMGESVSALMINDYARDVMHWGSYGTSASGSSLHRDERSLLGIAFRPGHSDALNSLFKLEWRRTVTRNAGIGDLRVAGAATLDTTSLAAVEAANQANLAAATALPGRLIGAIETIWAVSPRSELSFRYAFRYALIPGAISLPNEAQLNAVTLPRTNFIGIRAERGLFGSIANTDPDARLASRVFARVDGRAFMERASGSRAWLVTPSLGARITHDLEVEAGYRIGTLRDADFSAAGGPGVFVQINAHITESILHSPAAFWRSRLGTHN